MSLNARLVCKLISIYFRGERVEGQWLFGGVEKGDSSKCFLVPVENRKAETLLPLIQKHIMPRSTIVSDC